MFFLDINLSSLKQNVQKYNVIPLCVLFSILFASYVYLDKKVYLCSTLIE